MNNDNDKIQEWLKDEMSCFQLGDAANHSSTSSSSSLVPVDSNCARGAYVWSGLLTNGPPSFLALPKYFSLRTREERTLRLIICRHTEK